MKKNITKEMASLSATWDHNTNTLEPLIEQFLETNKESAQVYNLFKTMLKEEAAIAPLISSLPFQYGVTRLAHSKNEINSFLKLNDKNLDDSQKEILEMWKSKAPRWILFSSPTKIEENFYTFFNEITLKDELIYAPSLSLNLSIMRKMIFGTTLLWFSLIKRCGNRWQISKPSPTLKLKMSLALLL